MVDEPKGLFPRELESLRLASVGMINREIAVEMGVSKRTVDAYLRLANVKLGTGNRMKAVNRARELGFI